VEDTYNLLSHALRQAVGIIARKPGRELTAIAAEAGASLLGGASLKAALDLDWDDPPQRGQALVTILYPLEQVEAWLGTAPPGSDHPQVSASLAAAYQVCQQDVEVTAPGGPALRRKVAKERRIAIEDHEMRHGRKSRQQRIDGYKRHVLHDLDTGLVRAVGVTPANAPEATVTEGIEADLAAQAVRLSELHIDRAYLSSRLVRERPAELAIYCKAWPVRNGDRFPKTAFSLDWQRQILRCPSAGVDALRTRWGRAFSSGDLCGLPPARALYHQRSWAQRHDPPG
jgi:hypothetical protein